LSTLSQKLLTADKVLHLTAITPSKKRTPDQSAEDKIVSLLSALFDFKYVIKESI
jgi:hypothetical protein